MPTKLEKAVKELVDSQERQGQERRRKDQGLIDLLLDTAAVEPPAEADLPQASEEPLQTPPEEQSESTDSGLSSTEENVAMLQRHNPNLTDEEARIAIEEAGF
jgi:hypothetical protein